jgi:hypothetical protein
MPNGEIKRFKIKVRSEDKKEFSVSFTDAEESLDMIEDLERVKGAYEKRSVIMRIIGICKTEDGILFFPTAELGLPGARWVTAAAAASYPRGIPVNEIVSRTDLTSKKVSAYCTSKNNPTSNYLFKKDDAIFITPDGIDWLLCLLRKDKQIGEEVEKDEKETLS